MGNVYRGKLVATDLRFGVVVSRWNELITTRLLEGALDALERHGAAPSAVDVAWVPGAFEIPLVARRLALSGRYQAVICLGALIRGATPHFDYIAGAVTSLLARVGSETRVPVLFGVLTTDTIEPAIERAGAKAGHQ